jgi:hypothetical protein
MNKFQKVACIIARHELRTRYSKESASFKGIRNAYYNINMRNKEDIKDAINFKNFIKENWH